MLITEPKAHIIAEPAMHSLEAWARSQGLEKQVADTGTPLGKIQEDRLPENIVEFAGRHCYRSWSKGRETEEYIQNIIAEDHGSVLEHVAVTFAIAGVSRTLTHELVRHRVGVAISQESQRYVDAKDIHFVVPPLYLWMYEDLDHPTIKLWESQCHGALRMYIELMHSITPTTANSTIEKKRLTEAARSVLPNASETRMTWTANIRTLRHFFQKRGAPGADLEIRRMTILLYETLINAGYGIFFRDFTTAPGDFGVPYLLKDD